MARHALWRATFEDPHTALGWVWNERERFLRPSRESLGCLAQVGVVALLFLRHPLPALGLLAVVLLLPRLHRKPKTVEPLLTLPMPAKAFPCDVAIMREEAVIGTDRGAVTFLDGWLQYEGYRTAFSLSRSDVLHRLQNRLDLQAGGVEFRPDADVAKEFASTLDRWYRIDRAATGISILPPTSVYPSGIARSTVDAVYGAVKVTLGLAVFLALLRFHGAYWLIVLFGGPADLFVAVRDLRHLRTMIAEDRRRLEGNDLKGLDRPTGT